jgi:hypothetical protein
MLATVFKKLKRCEEELGGLRKQVEEFEHRLSEGDETSLVARLQRVCARLDCLLTDGRVVMQQCRHLTRSSGQNAPSSADGVTEQSVRLAELAEAIDRELGPVKDYLSAGLHRRLLLAVSELRNRFEDHALDGYALGRLAYARTAVRNALEERKGGLLSPA